MAWPYLLLSLLLLPASVTLAEEWQPAEGFDADHSGSALVYARRTATRPFDGTRVSAHLAYFDSPRYRLEVIDLGPADEPAYPSLQDAFRAADSIAGVNGGFFHPDWRPAGLMIAQGRRSNRFEAAKLLSGVLYSDERGIHLVRRGRFRDHNGIHALLQTGPYLVEHGRAVRGLSRSKSRRRTFIATDWRGHWAIGATTSQLTLAELAEWLASAGALTPWIVDRAINLDGGSSTGFFFDGGSGADPVLMPPGKRVRNLLGITLR